MSLWIQNGTEDLDAISHYERILGVCVALPVLMVIIVGMRAYTRIKILNNVGLDDWIIFFSAVGTCSQQLAMI